MYLFRVLLYLLKKYFDGGRGGKSQNTTELQDLMMEIRYTPRNNTPTFSAKEIVKRGRPPLEST